MAFFVLLKNVLKLNRQLGAIEQSVSIATETSENLFQLIVRGGGYYPASVVSPGGGHLALIHETRRPYGFPSSGILLAC